MVLGFLMELIGKPLIFLYGILNFKNTEGALVLIAIISFVATFTIYFAATVFLIKTFGWLAGVIAVILMFADYWYKY